MNKSELISEIASDTEMTQKDVGAVIDAFEKVVTKTVSKGEKVALTGFVTFDRVDRKARTARNPQTGEAIKVAASKAVKVSVGAKFKAAVKGAKK